MCENVPRRIREPTSVPARCRNAPASEHLSEPSGACGVRLRPLSPSEMSSDADLTASDSQPGLLLRSCSCFSCPVATSDHFVNQPIEDSAVLDINGGNMRNIRQIEPGP